MTLFPVKSEDYLKNLLFLKCISYFLNKTVIETQVTKILDQNGVQYKIKKHQNKALTCELAAQERGCRISQIVKTMVGKDDQGNYHVCLVPGDKTVKIKKVRKEAGGKRIDLVSPENIAKELDLIVGAISPLVFPESTKFYIDPTVLNEKYVNISSGDPLAGIELLSEDLVAMTDNKVCDIISGNS